MAVSGAEGSGAGNRNRSRSHGSPVHIAVLTPHGHILVSVTGATLIGELRDKLHACFPWRRDELQLFLRPASHREVFHDCSRPRDDDETVESIWHDWDTRSLRMQLVVRRAFPVGNSTSITVPSRWFFPRLVQGNIGNSTGPAAEEVPATVISVSSDTILNADSSDHTPDSSEGSEDDSAADDTPVID